MSAPAPKARVLIVDDTRFHRELARDALAKTAQVEMCEDGEQALERLSRGPVDLVLTDLTMPGLSGLELLERIQRAHPGTDVVIVTANASVDSAVHALRAGATDYLQKPVRAEDLILVVERTLGRRALVEENRRLRDERAVLEACKSLTPCLEPEDVYAVALDLALGSVGRPAGVAVYRRTALVGSEAVQCRGLHESVEVPLRKILAGDKPFDLDAMAGQDPVGALVWDSGPGLDALTRAGIETERLLVLPLQGEQNEIGVVIVFDDGRPFEDDECQRAEWVQGHANVSLRNAERYRRARDRAFVDDVTELYNARYLTEAMEREIQRSERYGSELSVLFLDLDRFKLVNDNHSHLVGTEALRELSRVLLESVRQVDTLARYGGDEFTILLVDTREAQALEVAERIRSSVAGHAFEAPGQTLSLTCSVGVATYPRHGTTREALLEAADKAMYRAKSNGRNRVCSASELS
ncbi:MAG: diguanylate cyclase [Myxococcota bacterium]|nr:diguanylate cyclase [Myxococcota bacterium]